MKTQWRNRCQSNFDHCQWNWKWNMSRPPAWANSFNVWQLQVVIFIYIGNYKADILTGHSRSRLMMSEFQSAASVSGFYNCACWLTVTRLWFTGEPEENVTSIRSQNVFFGQYGLQQHTYNQCTLSFRHILNGLQLTQFSLSTNLLSVF